MVVKMSETTSFFGPVIPRYTEQEAVDDGILAPNLSRAFPECNILTSNLWETIKEKCDGLDESMAYLDAIMETANSIYHKKRFIDDHDKNFFIVADFAWPVWFVRNENDKLTGMLKDDY